MAVNGDFAETAEHKDPVIITTHEGRATRQAGGGARTDEKKRTHRWHVVTFDLSVKPAPPQAEYREQDESHAPTWLERAIADETVLYVARHMQETQRTFRHERYTNMRGKNH
jgi:hypothetical protein